MAEPPEPGSKGTVAYLGPVASFTHQATLQDFPEGTGWAYQPCATIRDIFTAVSTGPAIYGIVPFENSTYGPVVDTLDLFAFSSEGLEVVGESYIAVHHALVGRRAPGTAPPADTLPPTTTAIDSSTSDTPDTPSAAHPSASHPSAFHPSPIHPSAVPSRPDLQRQDTRLSSGTQTPTPLNPSPALPRARPLVPLTHITRVFSHPQAFGQCDAFLAEYLKHAERHETASTAAAAARVAEHDGFEQAAIASVAAGERRGLDVLAEEIEDMVGNRTRFLTLTRKTAPEADAEAEASSTHLPADASAPAPSLPARPSAPAYKTLISFLLPPRAPSGTLAAALATFHAHGLDLTGVHARPSGRAAWDYVFVVECAGGAPGDGRVRLVMDLLRERTEGGRWHGRYRSRGAAEEEEGESEGREKVDLVGI